MYILLLAYYHSRYMNPLKKWASLLRENGCQVKEMYPDEYYREDVLEELKEKYDVIIYFGHGVPGGWSGFSYISVADLSKIENISDDRIVFSMSCYSLDDCDGISLGRMLLNNSYAGIVAGYKGRVRYEDNLKNLSYIMNDIICKKGITKKDLYSIRNYGHFTLLEIIKRDDFIVNG